MKKVLYSLLVIGIVSSIVVGSGAIAYFSDAETSSGNSFTAGTMDLKVDGGDAAVTTVDVSNGAPGDSGSGSTTLKNGGTLSGELDITMSAIAETAGADESAELANNLKMVLWVDADASRTFDSGDIELVNDGSSSPYSITNPSLDYVIANTYDSVSWDAVKTMASNDVEDFTISWKIPSTAGNDIQGDSMSFDVDFVLEQAAKD